MTVPERVVDFLRKRKGSSFCDDCIAEQLKLKKRQEVQPITATLALCSDFSRDKDICSSCPPSARLRLKFVTKAH